MTPHQRSRRVKRFEKGDENAAVPSPLTPEQVAFKRGANGLPCVYSAGHLRRAWSYGRRFAEQTAKGLRPLDTVRRVDRLEPTERP